MDDRSRRVTADGSRSPEAPSDAPSRQRVRELLLTDPGDATVHDVHALLTTLSDGCCDAADVTAVGIMLATPSGELEVAAWSNDAAPYLDVIELQTRQGPCLDSYRTNHAVATHDLATPETARRWPLFTPAARTAGLGGAEAVPMRLDHRVIGGLSLLRHHSTALDAGTLSTVQAIADLATAAILRGTTDRRVGLASEAHLTQALQDRMIIEHAAGMIAERDNVDIDQAHAELRDRARIDHRPRIDIASDIVNSTPRSTATSLRSDSHDNQA